MLLYWSSAPTCPFIEWQGHMVDSPFVTCGWLNYTRTLGHPTNPSQPVPSWLATAVARFLPHQCSRSTRKLRILPKCCPLFDKNFTNGWTHKLPQQVSKTDWMFHFWTVDQSLFFSACEFQTYALIFMSARRKQFDLLKEKSQNISLLLCCGRIWCVRSSVFDKHCFFGHFSHVYSKETNSSSVSNFPGLFFSEPLSDGNMILITGMSVVTSKSGRP